MYKPFHVADKINWNKKKKKIWTQLQWLCISEKMQPRLIWCLFFGNIMNLIGAKVMANFACVCACVCEIDSFPMETRERRLLSLVHMRNDLISMIVSFSLERNRSCEIWAVEKNCIFFGLKNCFDALQNIVAIFRLDFINKSSDIVLCWCCCNMPKCTDA